MKAKEQTDKIARETAKSTVLDPLLIEKFSKKFVYPEKALRDLIEPKMKEGKTLQQAIEEIERALFR